MTTTTTTTTSTTDYDYYAAFVYDGKSYTSENELGKLIFNYVSKAYRPCLETKTGAIWSVGEWTECSVTCNGGLQKRYKLVSS